MDLHKVEVLRSQEPRIDVWTGMVASRFSGNELHFAATIFLRIATNDLPKPLPWDYRMTQKTTKERCVEQAQRVLVDLDI